uniref:hypothetical protein n=1 Tax=Ningiella ruwaisensis TaxID=2364274 RepID=UPI00109FBFA1|nr:hypothetical protein [Ningiella ruwaisensis]
MKKTLLIAGLLAIFIAAFIWSLPAAIDNDLSQIGNGKKSVVFIYDLNRVVSNEQTIEINKAREALDDTVNFLVTRTGYPATEDLMQKYQAESVELLFFDENGALFLRKFAPVDAAELGMILANMD